MKSNNKIEAIIYLILVLVLCASLVGVITNITKKGEEFFGVGGDKPSTTSTTEKATTTKPTETTKPVETTQKPAETTAPIVVSCKHDNVVGSYSYVGDDKHLRRIVCSDCPEVIVSYEEDCAIENCLCANCGHEEHNYVNCVCTACGRENHTVVDYHCTNCDYVAQHYHNQTNPTVTLEPTCTTTGEKKWYCDICGVSTWTETIPALGHDIVDYHCTRCDYIAEHYHNQGNSSVVLEPTCTTTGKKEWYCTVCGSKQYEETIPALGHNLVNCVCTACDMTVHTYDGELHCAVCGQ